MDKKALRNKRNKYHTSRTHERPNQGILGRVASKVKGFLNPWISSVWSQTPQGETESSSDNNEETVQQQHEFTQQAKTYSSKRPRLRLQDNSLSGCSSSSLCLEPPEETNFTSNSTSSRGIKRLRLHEHSIPSCSMGIFNEMPCEQDFSTHNSVHGNKRQRLRLPEDSSILNETQSWLEVPNRPNIFGQASHVPSNNVQRPLIENKESSVIMNGDDHSENSEGSASTSGCSSLVSHKDRANCISSMILGESDGKGRRDVASQKENPSVNMNSTRMSLWSTNDRSEPRSIRSPSLMMSGQPSFSLSAFSNPAKLNSQADKRVASPFYQGKTTFGGASASRRMPIAAAPYQTEKPIRNQIKFRSNQSKDNYEGMSSAAKRILQTLETMSSPVIDAKKIPNTNKSPVDLSLYLMPPKCRKPLHSTPAGPIKGPPIADISTISKLTTIKNYGQKTFQNTLLDSPTLLNKEPCSTTNSILPVSQVTTTAPTLLPSGGGKIRNKLNQQHQSAAKNSFTSRMSNMESRMSEYIDAVSDTAELPEISLPITSLPTFSFGNNTTVKSTKNSNQSGKDFVFSNPIEHIIPKTALSNACSSPLTYKFSSPLVTTTNKSEDNIGNKFTFSNPIELEVPLSSSTTTNMNVTKDSSPTTWKCNSCWVQNPAKETKCMCCEAPNPSKENVAAVKESTAEKKKLSTEASTWECSSCWVRNPADKAKCVACEAPNPSKTSSSVGDQTSDKPITVITATSGSGFKFSQTTNSNHTSNFTFGTSSSSKSSSSSTIGFKVPNVETEAKTVSFGDFKIPISKSASSGSEANKISISNSSLQSSPSLSSFSKNVIPEKSWECDVCLVKNELSKQKCIACGSLKSNNKLTGYSFRLSKEESSVVGTTSSETPSNSVTSSPVVSVSTGLDSTPSTLTSSSTSTSTTSTSITTVPSSISVTSCLSVLFSKPSDSSKISSFTSNTESSDKKPGSIMSPSLTAANSFKINTPEQSSSENKSLVSSSDIAKSNTSLNQKLETISQNPLLQPPNKKFEFSSSPMFNSSAAQQDVTKISEKQSSESFSKCSFTPVTHADKPASQFSLEVKPKSSWECSNCLTKNDADKQTCSSCNKSQTLESGSDSVNVSKPQTIGIETTNSTTTTPAPIFQFGSQPSITSSAAPAFPAVTATFSFDSAKTSKPQITGIEANSVTTTSVPIFQFGNQTSITSSAAPAFPAVNPTFTFGKTKEVSNPASSQPLGVTPASNTQSIFGSSAAAPLAFGKSSDKPAVGLFNFGGTASSTAPIFQFGSTTQSDSSLWECTNCHVKNDSEKQKCLSCDSARTGKSTSGFTFKGANEIKSNTNSMTFNTPTTTTASISGFTFNATASASTTPFVFGAKNESVATTSSIFTFGTGTTMTSKPSGTGFDTQSSAPIQSFQFGNQSSGTSATGSAFGAGGNAFTFGAKASTTNPIQPATVTQAPTPAFGSAPSQNPLFGNSKAGTSNPTQPTTVTQAPTPAFGSAPSQNPLFGNSITSPAFGKQAPGGFNFGLPAASNAAPVFQFGAAEKKPATNSGFSFGTPSQEVSNFQPQFNVNTPPSFNFGASSAPGPFQFAASSENSQHAASPRRIRKAVRRMK